MTPMVSLEPSVLHRLRSGADRFSAACKGRESGSGRRLRQIRRSLARTSVSPTSLSSVLQCQRSGLPLLVRRALEEGQGRVRHEHLVGEEVPALSKLADEEELDQCVEEGAG